MKIEKAEIPPLIENDFDIQASRALAPMFYRAPAPPNMKPREFQLAGVEYALGRNHVIFGDAPGVGKTAECILLANALNFKRILVVCPASLRLNWAREINLWSDIPDVSVYTVLKSKDGVNPHANYLVISYALLRNEAVLNALMDVRWDNIILDECHAIKDPYGNRQTRPICAPDLLPSVCGRYTLASGTLLPNQPIECYNAIRLLNWEAINRASLEEFRKYYYSEGGGFIRGFVTDPQTGVRSRKLHWSSKVRNQPQNLADLQYRLRKYLMVRRLKSEVMPELPEKSWHLFPLEVTSEMREALKHPGWNEASRMYELDEDAFDHGIPVDGAVSTARRLLGEAKAPGVADYVEELLLEGVGKIILGAWHRSVLEYLCERLKKYKFVYMDGSSTSRAKQRAVDRFQEEDDVQLIIGQTQVMGEGWTLTAAQDVVNAEPDWRPGVNDQLIDRAHRQGQRGAVLGHMPIVLNTLDERIIGTVIKKDKSIHEAMDKA